MSLFLSGAADKHFSLFVGRPQLARTRITAFLSIKIVRRRVALYA